MNNIGNNFYIAGGLIGASCLVGGIPLIISYHSNKKQLNKIYDYSKQKVIYTKDFENKLENAIYNIKIYAQKLKVDAHVDQMGRQATQTSLKKIAEKGVEYVAKAAIDCVVAPIFMDPYATKEATKLVYDSFAPSIVPKVTDYAQKNDSYVWNLIKNPVKSLTNPFTRARAEIDSGEISKSEIDTIKNKVFKPIEKPEFYRYNGGFFTQIGNIFFNAISYLIQFYGKVAGKREKNFTDGPRLELNRLIQQAIREVFGNATSIYQANIAKELNLNDLTSERFQSNWKSTVQNYDRAAEKVNQVKKYFRPLRKWF